MAANLNQGPEYGRSFNGAGVRRISRPANTNFGNKRNKRFGTWNVRSMFQAGKVQNTIKEMKRLHMDILGISEMRWTQSGKFSIEDYTVYCSGDSSQNHRCGVAFIVSKEVNRAVINFVPLSSRIALLQFKGNPVNYNFIQVYAPTADSDEEEVEAFYEDLQNLLLKVKSREMAIVMGDLNAKIGRGMVESIVGKFGLGDRNDRGDRLVQFCQDNSLAVMNTLFKLPKRRLYTWKSPADQLGHVVRNQIDYILVRKRFKNALKSVKTMPGADVGSDHNLLLAEIRLDLKRQIPRSLRRSYDVNLLKDPVLKERLVTHLEENLAPQATAPADLQETAEDTSVEHQWNCFKDKISGIRDQSLCPVRPPKNKKWMTDEILDLMEVRRQFKNRNINRYREVNREIRRKIRKAKEDWLAEQCSEIEAYDHKHDSFHVHKKVKEAAGLFSNSHQYNILKDGQGNIILDNKNKLRIWKNYAEELFADDRPPFIPDGNASSGPSITVDEVIYALRSAKNGKAPGPDDIPIEILKLLDVNGVKVLHQLFNCIYDTGKIPDDWLMSTFVTLPKKPSATQCKDYRTISLMSHVLKLFLRIIHQRIYRRIEEHLTNTQFGFRNGLGTREALFSMQVLIQRCRDVNCEVHICFIDFEKAFDRVQHSKMIEVLQRIGLDDKDIRFIANLYWNQRATIRIDGQLSEEICIRRGVRQGCILSPLLFNAYAEMIFSEAIEGISEGITINGKGVNNLRYADDTTLIADSAEGLERLLQRVANSCANYGLSLNVKKTNICRSPSMEATMLSSGSMVLRLKKLIH